MILDTLYTRLERPSTGSFLTVRLRRPLSFGDSCEALEKLFEGWEVLSGCPVDPDEQEDTNMVIKISSEKYMRLREECSGGVCLACGAIHDSGIEPDAEKYECQECGENQVYGIEQALLIGAITVED